MEARVYLLSGLSGAFAASALNISRSMRRNSGVDRAASSKRVMSFMFSSVVSEAPTIGALVGPDAIIPMQGRSMVGGWKNLEEGAETKRAMNGERSSWNFVWPVQRNGARIEFEKELRAEDDGQELVASRRSHHKGILFSCCNVLF